jgi:ABC-type branched-subunit amino acid transport system substrate-binding protein
LAQGLETKKWMDLVVKMINEQGGWKIGNDVYTLEYTAYDGGYNDPTKTRSAVEKAVLQDGIKFLIADWGDVPQVTGTVTEPNKVLTLGLDNTGELLKPGSKYFINSSGIYFNAGMNFNLFAGYKAKGATDHLTVGIDSQMVRMITKTQNAAAAASGLKIIDPLYYTADTVDFGPLATKIISLNPSFVNLGTTTGDNLVNLLTALHDAGYKGLISPGFMDEATLDKMVAKFGKEWFEGMATTATDPRSVQTDQRMVDMMDRYTKEYGTFNADGVRWFTSWFFFEDAVNATQSIDPDVLAQYLKKSSKPVMTLGGYAMLVARPDLQNYETIDAVIPDFIGVIHDGKLVVEKGVSIKDQYLASIMSYGLTDVYQQYWDKYGKPQFPDAPSLLDYADLTK